MCFCACVGQVEKSGLCNIYQYVVHNNFYIHRRTGQKLEVHYTYLHNIYC